MAEAGERGKKPQFEPGIVYNNPFNPPGTASEGYRWEPVSKHVTKRYVESWKLVPLPGTTLIAESARAMEEAEDRSEANRSPGQPASTFPTPEQIEESRKNWFPNIEDTLPEGDKD